MANIMVVDDSAIVRKTITKQLTDFGHEVVYQAVDGKDAIANYKKGTIDLVTMDISMPEMNGIEALKGILEIDKDAKVVMITSHGEESMVIEAITIGSIGYLLKPITKEKLQELLKKVKLDNE
ncbi:MAG: response regulator [Arcobacteraceae bacterium]|jgi:two-component system chemotaxis response regulator CheY|nr:response regulator [Arcobacteraceae bacterium]